MEATAPVAATTPAVAPPAPPIPADPKAPEVPAKPEVATPKDLEDSKRFAALAKRERALVRQQEELKAERAKLETRDREYADLQKGRDRQTELEALKKTNALKWLEAQGVTYQDITSLVLNDGKATPDMAVREVKQQFEAYKAEQEKAREDGVQAEKQRQQVEYDRVLEDFKVEVTGYIDSNKGEYELIALHDATSVVLSTIEQHFENTQKVLSIKEAAEMVESWLEDRIAKSLDTKRLKSRMAAPPPTKDADTKPVPPSAQTRTITNSMTTSAPSLLPAQTEQDRIKRALAALSR
jgi:hypothetical protein